MAPRGCIIAKRGAPEIEDSAAIQRIVDLLSTDPSLGFCKAVRRIAKGIRGDTARHYSRLRKKYRRLEKRGALPKPSDDIERKKEALAAAYARRTAAIETAKSELAAAEQWATAQGLDLSVNLDDLGSILYEKYRIIEDFLLSNPEDQLAYYLNNDVLDPVEAQKRLGERQAEFERLGRQLEALGPVRRLRVIARQPT